MILIKLIQAGYVKEKFERLKLLIADVEKSC